MTKGKLYRIPSSLYADDHLRPNLIIWGTPDLKERLGEVPAGSSVIWLETFVLLGMEIHRVIVKDLVGWYDGDLEPLNPEDVEGK